MRAIIKFGGSVITEKGTDMMRVRVDALHSLSEQIASSLEKEPMELIIVHGAGPFGHVPAKKYKLAQGGGKEQARGMALTHQGMERLNFEVVDSLIGQGIDAIAFQPSSCCMLDDLRITNFGDNALEAMMGLGLVPVIYGDVVLDSSQGMGILSGDQIVSYLAKKMNADRVIIITSYNGIFDRDPQDPDAVRFPVVDDNVLSELDSRSVDGTDVTGGIRMKVSELLDLARVGISSQIVGSDDGLLERALLGEHVGTVIKSTTHD